MDIRTIIVGIIVFVFMALYCTTLFTTLRKVPKASRVLPAWFVWFFLIPLVGFVFQWMMLPFGIPLTLKNAVKNDAEGVRFTHALMGLGLIQVLMPTITIFVHKDEMNLIFACLTIATWATYWICISIFKRKYLSKV